MHQIALREKATSATQARFEGKPFDWAKSATCIHLLRFHAAQMGHKLPIVPRFRSALTAKRALLATGHDSLPDLLDAHFERIPPAFMRLGDVMALPGTDGFESLNIKGSAHKFLGWHEQAEGCAIIDIDADELREAVGAWRL